jgi:hypothetical protein
MSSLVGFLLALLAQLMVLPTSWQQQQAASMTTTEITTAQQQQQLLSAAQAWISQNLATVQATATAATPMVIPVSTLAAANVGLPASFSATNPFGQTWQVQALQPIAGTLQILVTSINGTALTDLQAAGIAANVGQPGGFIPQNDSGVYPLGAARAYGNQANWNIPTAGYANVSGGHPAALLVIANGQVQNNALYRVSVPGQPQLNQMQTAIDMNMNNVNNANAVNAQNVVTPGGSNAKSVQVGNTIFYGDGSNAAVRANGGLYIQNQAGTGPADIVQVGNVTSSGTVSAQKVVAPAGGNVVVGNTTFYGDGSNSAIYQNGSLFLQHPGGGAADIAIVGNVNSNAQVTGAFLQPTGGVTLGSGCGSNAQFGTTGSGPAFCQNGVWTAAALTSFQQIGWYNNTHGVVGLGWFRFCYISGINGPNNNGGVAPTGQSGSLYFWGVQNNSPDSSNILVSCMS